MENIYGIDWDSIKGRYDEWWHRSNTDRPLINIKAPLVRGQLEQQSEQFLLDYCKAHNSATPDTVSYDDYWLDIDKLLARNKGMYDASYYVGETYPKMFASLGVTSLAVFMGGTPLFFKDTIWCQHSLSDPETDKILLDSNNHWLRWSLDTTREIAARSNGNFRIGIPDLCEHMDVMASLYDTQELLMHMYDYEDEILQQTCEVQKQWFDIYQAHYDLVREPDGFCNYGPFQLLGKGKIAKLQCDMSAMIGTEMFDRFALPFLREQTEWLDSSVYHLDGPDAVKHLDSVLSLPKLTALQWTPGAGNLDGGDEQWDYIYEKALDAGKSIYALVAPANIKRFVKRFGCRGVLISTMASDRAEADEIMNLISH